MTYQETAHLMTLYPLLTNDPITVHNGCLPLRSNSGLRVRLLPKLFSPDCADCTGCRIMWLWELLGAH